MKKYIVASILMLLLFACKSQQIIPKKETTRTVKDSTYSTLKVVDTIQVIRPADTARISRLIKDLSSIPTVVKSKPATISLSKIGDQIQEECECKELKAAVKIYKETIVTQTQVIETQKETISVITNQLNSFQKIFFWIGIAVAISIIAPIVIRAIKPKLPIT